MLRAKSSPTAPTATACCVFDDQNWRWDWYADKSGALVCVNSGVLDGLRKAAVDKDAELLAAKGLGEKTTFRLRDWDIGRQRYWGTPIPIIHCRSCGPQPVPEGPAGRAAGGLRAGWFRQPAGQARRLPRRRDLPCCGKPARRETDTMDTFVDSSWYFMRYCDPKNADAMVAEGARGTGCRWTSTSAASSTRSCTCCTRFWTKVMRDLGLVTVDEPFKRLLTQGMVLNHIYSRRTAKGGKGSTSGPRTSSMCWTSRPAGGRRPAQERGRGADGLLPVGTAIDYEGVGTMSKSKNNGVDPQDLIEKYGADTARLYTMFTAPPEATLEWNDAAVEAATASCAGLELRRQARADRRRRRRCQDLAGVAFGKEAKALRREIHNVLKAGGLRLPAHAVQHRGLGRDEDTQCAGGLQRRSTPRALPALAEGFGILLRSLYPATPHLTHGLWAGLAIRASSASCSMRPGRRSTSRAGAGRDRADAADQRQAARLILVPASADKAAIEAAAVASEPVRKQADGAAPKKVIVVPGRLVNVVL